MCLRLEMLVYVGWLPCWFVYCVLYWFLDCIVWLYFVLTGFVVFWFVCVWFNSVGLFALLIMII